ncbi:MAG TPA: hypothetical protein VK284_09520 [Streptosporangiaceae bacterium]|nr:hypothetical protein [Streptosporangiaceae bacterium]
MMLLELEAADAATAGLLAEPGLAAPAPEPGAPPGHICPAGIGAGGHAPLYGWAGDIS